MKKKLAVHVQRSLKLAAEEIRSLSLDKGPCASPGFDRLEAVVEAAELLGLQVGGYKEKLARLRSILDDWEDGLDRAAARWRRRRELWEKVTAAHSRQKKRLRKEMAVLDEEEERERKLLRICSSYFESVATAPWHCEI